jgi:hypothetical protein
MMHAALARDVGDRHAARRLVGCVVLIVLLQSLAGLIG